VPVYSDNRHSRNYFLERELPRCSLNPCKKIVSSPLRDVISTLRVGNNLKYVQVASTGRLTHYGYEEGRGKTTIDAIAILPMIERESILR
jgi:hypothetical protein